MLESVAFGNTDIPQGSLTEIVFYAIKVHNYDDVAYTLNTLTFTANSNIHSNFGNGYAYLTDTPAVPPASPHFGFYGVDQTFPAPLLSIGTPPSFPPGISYIVISFFSDGASTIGDTDQIASCNLTIVESATIYNNTSSGRVITTAIPATVAISTPTIADYNAALSSTLNIVYAVKVDNNSAATAEINGITITLGGTFIGADIGNYAIRSNSSPVVSGSSLETGFSFPSPGTVVSTFTVPYELAAGSSIYFIATLTISPAATPGHTIKVNGATNPATLNITGSPTVTNNQADNMGTVTIIP